jgi:alpha-galactosidase
MPREVSVNLADIGFTGPVKVRDLWNHQDLGSATGTFTQKINSHGAALYSIQPQ